MMRGSTASGWGLIASVTVLGLGAQAEARAQTIDPTAVRAAALASGLDSLANVSTPPVENLDQFLRPGNEAQRTAVRLGKALFWDTQVGSDGQACGSCHFHAFADSRPTNQLSPGIKNLDPDLQDVFDPTASGSAGGPNYTLTEDDFPFHLLEDPEENNFDVREVLFDTNDVASSQGVFAARFERIERGQSRDTGEAVADGVFNVAGVNVRRVEPRNTPTIVNAVFNHSNFWDGRAHNLFNGVSIIGPLDREARIWVEQDGALIQKEVRIPNSSLASQAVGPPINDFEMSFLDRSFPDIGRKLLSLRPLGLQLVHPKDSVLGKLSLARLVGGGNGLRTTYAGLIKRAFRQEYWASNESIELAGGPYEQIEANFPLFFGLAIQLYESTLISDRTPFDQFLEGDDDSLEQEELQGLLVFVNRGAEADGTSRNPPEVDAAIERSGRAIGAGNCVSCHGGPELTDAAFTSLAEEDELELIELEETSQLVDGLLGPSAQEGLLDNGFSNIGVLPTNDDPGRGGEAEFTGEPEGSTLPLSFARQALAGLDDLLPEGAELPCVPDDDCPDKVQVDGAFKVPGLRNVELTGPYFHSGGQATLLQTVEFYDRQGDFGDVNIANLDPNMAFVDIDEPDEEPLIRTPAGAHRRAGAQRGGAFRPSRDRRAERPPGRRVGHRLH